MCGGFKRGLYIAFGNFYSNLLNFFFFFLFLSFFLRYFPNFISFFVVVVFRGNKNTFLFDHNLLAIEKHVGMFQLWLEVGKSMPIFRKKTS